MHIICDEYQKNILIKILVENENECVFLHDHNVHCWKYESCEDCLKKNLSFDTKGELSNENYM